MLQAREQKLRGVPLLRTAEQGFKHQRQRMRGRMWLVVILQAFADVLAGQTGS